MKQFLFFVFFAFAFTQAFAQKDVTTFLGIPVDGTKSEMIAKLKAKGFTYNKQNDVLVGEFNGRKSNIMIKTNRNKVWRIMVSDADVSSESDIKIRFNNLCSQFERKSDKYTSPNKSMFYIPDEEDISYEMMVNNKRYEALYFQLPDMSLFNFDNSNHRIHDSLLKVYTEEQLLNPTPEQAEDIDELTKKEISKISQELFYSKPVWFMISSFYGKYYISLFYDNEYNNNTDDDL